LYLSTIFPNAPLLGMGFSLGAIVLTRYLAEEGEDSRLVSAFSLGCVSHLILIAVITLLFTVQMTSAVGFEKE
jgi:predicted alpha/beta-fold hydrolase